MFNPPPELEIYVKNAYNAKDGNFLSRSVFVLEYTKGQTVNWGSDGKRDIPDAVSASAGTQSYSRQTSVLMEDQADYDRLYSASVNAEYSGVSWSGSVQSSFLYHGNLFTSTSSTYALNSYAQSVLTFERGPLTQDALTSDFIKALAALPATISTPQDQAAYFTFFDSYGTHFTHYGTMGGTIVMETDIADSIFQSSATTEVSVALSVGYQAIVNSGKMDVSAAYKNSDFLNKHKNDIQITLSVMGGLYAPDGTMTAWMDSIYNSPSLLLNVPAQMSPCLTQLQCISNLVAYAPGVKPSVADNMQQLLPAYLTPAYFNDGLLGSPRTTAFSLDKQATLGDGFLFGMIQKTSDGDRGYLQAFNDNTPDPRVMRACASQHFYMGTDSWVASNSLMMPAPQGSYYMATETTTSGEPKASLNFVGLGSVDTACFGDWKELTLNTKIPAPSDGFVVALIDSGQNSARGTITGTQWAGGSSATTIAGASQHYYLNADRWVPCNSFCMPVCKGTTYQVTLNQTSGSPTGRSFFMPMKSGVAVLGAAQSRQPGVTNQAQTDGFLLAFMNAAVDGARAQVDLFTYPNMAELVQLGLLASATVHLYTEGDIWVPCNSAMIPVSRGNFYKANYTPTVGKPEFSLLWIPIYKAKPGADH